jgi:murein DD-endopeptidase MepM/ murein hydrolase activator NlpD
VRVFFLLVFLILSFCSGALAKELYLPYKYPGSLGYFKVKDAGEFRVVLGYKGKRWLFKGVKGAKKVYFAIPYRVRAPFSLSLFRGKERVFFKIVPVQKKHYRVSKIWVKERALTRELIERIRRENKLLRKILREVTPKKFSSTKLYPPLPRLLISTPFGAKRIINGKKRSIHWGTDFRAKRGTPIRAVLGGKVVLARELYFTGKTVVIDHGLGLHTLYAHMSRITVKEGQRVKRGQLIGRVGSTGRSTGPHLHFGFYVQGVKADPMIVIKEKL